MNDTRWSAAQEREERIREAASDLLEALKRLRNECVAEGLSGRPGFDCWIIMADAAIAKAEGRHA